MKKLLSQGIMILVIAGTSMAAEHVLVEKVPSSIPKIDLDKAIVIALANRKWNVVSVEENNIKAELDHRSYECTIDIKDVNNVLLLNDLCLYENDRNDVNEQSFGYYVQKTEKVKKEIPGRWLRNLEKDMQNTVNNLSILYK
jgi:hypothetical protein